MLSTLGAGRGDDPATRGAGTANLIEAMRTAGIRRLIVMGGFHVRMPGDPGNLGQRLIGPLLRISPGIDYEDTQEFARVVLSSDRDWTLVRSVRVDPGDCRTGTMKLGPWSSVAPGDVADFMLRCLHEDAEIGRAPMICV